MAPLREVAVLRCYIQMSGTVGVTVGSPLGGLLTDLLGWRWSFLIKVPLGLFCFAMAAWRLPSATNLGHSDMKEGGEREDSKPDLNLPGISLLGTVIAAIMGVCQLLSEELPQKDLLMTIAIATVVIGGALFGLNERYWAKTALVPMYLLKTNGIGLAYIAQFLAMFTFCGVSFVLRLLHDEFSHKLTIATVLQQLRRLLGPDQECLCQPGGPVDTSPGCG